MKAAVYISRTNTGAISPHLTAMCDGLEAHGISVSRFNDRPDPSADFGVCWGWRKGSRVRQYGYGGPLLVMERAYFPDRMEWSSLGWDGLNGRARWNEAQDSGERFWKHFGRFACEWEEYDGYHLVIGQVLGDSALQGVDFQRWVRDTVDDLEEQGRDVRYRPHPEALKRGQVLPVPEYMVVGGTLDAALSEAACVVTFNSNTSTDAALAGVPAITMDEGAMAWPVTSHSIHEPLVMPDRTEWFRDMAWRQWSMEEVSSGFAWDVVRGSMEP